MLMRLHLSCCTWHILQSDVVVIFSTLVNHVAQHPWERPAYLYIQMHLNFCVCVKNVRIKTKYYFWTLKKKIHLQCIEGKIHKKIVCFIKSNES